MNPLVKMFDKTADSYSQAAIIPNLGCKRLIDRLEDLHHFQPHHILDLGCGTGFCLEQLHQKYLTSHITGIDWSYCLLRKAQETFGHDTLVHCIQANICELPFLYHTFDLICASLSLLWIDDLPQYLLRLKNWLKPNGLLLFTVLGSDSFQELSSFSSPYPWAFSDLHTLGDSLVSGGWQDVVMDVDRFLANYKNVQTFYTELQQLGLESLMPHQVFQKREKTHSNQQCRMTWEIVYGQAWNMETSYSLNKDEIAIPITQLLSPRK